MGEAKIVNFNLDGGTQTAQVLRQSTPPKAKATTRCQSGRSFARSSMTSRTNYRDGKDMFEDESVVDSNVDAFELSSDAASTSAASTANIIQKAVQTFPRLVEKDNFREEQLKDGSEPEYYLAGAAVVVK